MRIIPALFGFIFYLNSVSFAQNDSLHVSDKIVGKWALYKDSSSIGNVRMLTNETDTITFSKEGNYFRLYSGMVENGKWNYSKNDSAIILTQRRREYTWNGQSKIYDMGTEIFVENNKISNNEFIDTFIADMNKNYEIITFYIYYRKIE